MSDTEQPKTTESSSHLTVKVEKRTGGGKVEVIELSGWVPLEDILNDVQSVAERGGWTAA